MKPDPLDNPQRNAATLRNLTHGMRSISVNAWLEEVTLTEVIEAHWAAQARRADELEKLSRRAEQ